jgi:hypothetical protein
LKKVFYFNKETDISENIKNNLDLKELFDEFVKQN